MGESELERLRQQLRGAVDDLDALLGSVRNLRGWRVQGQTHYLAHVDALEQRSVTLAQRLGGSRS
jgi:hypothetical protein